MLAALDVHYRDTQAVAAAIVFADWLAAEPLAQYRVPFEGVGDYAPGEFYRRELGPLLAVIAAVREPVRTWIIDGYCQLSPDGAPGLGAHLSAALPARSRVVGVAKNVFRRATQAIAVQRGDSRRPLYVTAVGIEPEDAARAVVSMHGVHRIPTLLGLVDGLSRSLS
jgi:deoxyribonuclease V